ncbi:MAG: lipopolysaccharide transport periplasmic protein LptA [Pseudomonadota bacterium]
MFPASFIAPCAATVLLCMPLIVTALDSDRDQPIHLESDKADLDEQKGINIFTGNVHLRQGTMHLRGDIMTVYVVDGSIDRAEINGSPATFVQRPEGKDKDMHATASRMEYHASDERIILLGEARVRDAEGNDFRSDRIIYHVGNNTVNAGGDTGTGSRVYITLPPKSPSQDDAEPAAP